jgi:hypothetical protein
MSNHPDTVIHSDWFDKTKYIDNIPQPSYILVDRPGIFSKTLPNIYIQVEPNIIVNSEDYLLNNHHIYDTIFTFNSNILNKCKNAKFYIYGTTWITKDLYENVDTGKKIFKISTLAGSKNINNSLGHIFRQTIHHNQPRLNNFPITFYRSSQQHPHLRDYGNNPLLEGNTTKNSKIKLFEEYQFAIIIENSRQTNYFTEKIMDCILTKTIPIYWGCPNIGDFFDTTGWVILETPSIEELTNKLSILDEKYYHKYTSVIDNNHKEAQKYVDFYININNAK